jgi:hypothetical protein
VACQQSVASQCFEREKAKSAKTWFPINDGLKRLNRIDVLVVDDWAMAAMSEPERRSESPPTSNRRAAAAMNAMRTFKSASRQEIKH